jgi:hypothetical protein
VSFSDFVPLVQSLASLINDAPSAEAAWRAIRVRERQLGHAVAEVSDGDITAEVAVVAEQLRQLFRESPPPTELRLLFFGLFTAANLDTLAQEAGYYVAGTTRDLPFVVDSSSDLADDILDYEPENRYLESPLLQRIKAAALANEDDYDRYDYALMLGAASVLSLSAVRTLGMGYRVVIGFDSGDAVELQA